MLRSRSSPIRLRSLRTKALAPILAVGAVVGIVGVWLTWRTYASQLDHHMYERGRIVTNAINAAAMSGAPDALDLDALARAVRELAGQQGVTLIVAVAGQPPRVVATSNPEWAGLSLSELPRRKVQDDLIDALETRTVHRHYHNDSMEYDVSWPMRIRTEDRPQGEFAEGAVMIHLDALPVREQLLVAAWEISATLVLALTAVGATAWLLLEWLVFQPLNRIREVMDTRAAGGENVRLPPLPDDEIGRVGRTLEDMLKALDASEQRLRESNENLEGLVRERTAALERTFERLRHADRMAAVGTMAAGIAHDLGNLLMPIRGRLRALAAAGLDARSTDHVGDIEQSVHFLEQLSQNLRQCAVDPGAARSSVGQTDLTDWWSRVGPLMGRALRSRVNADRAADIVARIPSGLPPVGVAAHRLTQALLNLVVNAGDAAVGDCRVEVWAAPADVAGVVRLGVTDNGPGMSADVAARAFEPFFSTKPRGASTGLGLGLVRAVADGAGGSVHLDSAPGCGATVVLMLPAAAPSADKTSIGEPPSLVAGVSIADARLAAYACSLLAAEGFHAGRCPPSEPVDASVWLTEPSSDVEAVRRFLAVADRAVLVLGAIPADWPAAGVFEMPVSLSREALGRALRAAGLRPAGDRDGGEEEADSFG